MVVLHSSEPGGPGTYGKEAIFVAARFVEGSISDLAESLVSGKRGVIVLIGGQPVAMATVANYSLGGNRLLASSVEEGQRRVSLSLKGVTLGEVPAGAELVSALQSVDAEGAEHRPA